MTANILSTEVVHRKGQAAYGVFTVSSQRNPEKNYRVDITNGRCDCPAWKFARAGENGKRAPCKHLRSVGYSENTVVVTAASKVAPSMTKPDLPTTDYSKVL